MGKNGRTQGMEYRAAAWMARHPGALVAPGSVATSVIELGPVTTGSIGAGAIAAGVCWARAHPPSYDRHGATVLRAWRRRWTRYVGRNWANTCYACDLVRSDRRTGRDMVPRIIRVSSPTPSIDRIKVRLVRGQSLRLWQDRQEELAAALNVETLGITRIKPQVLVLTLVHGNPFDRAVPATEIPETPEDVDLGKLVLGETEYGDDWTEALLGQHWLISGATGSGKSGLMWNPLRAIGPSIRDGLVKVWMVDPKSGMETGQARPLFHRYADHVDDDTDSWDDEGDDNVDTSRGESAVELVTAFRDEMKATQEALRAQGQRKVTISPEMPLQVLMVDEMAMITALGGSGATRKLTKLLAEIMTQGRAAGFSVCAYLQEPTKDILPVRDLFTRRISLRTTSATYVDMVLGDGARMRGALADEIPTDEDCTGIGFRVDDRSRNPIRVRAGLVTDG